MVKMETSSFFQKYSDNCLNFYFILMIEFWLINNEFKERKYHNGSKIINLGVTPAFSPSPHPPLPLKDGVFLKEEVTDADAEGECGMG